MFTLDTMSSRIGSTTTTATLIAIETFHVKLTFSGLFESHCNGCQQQNANTSQKLELKFEYYENFEKLNFLKNFLLTTKFKFNMMLMMLHSCLTTEMAQKSDLICKYYWFGML